MSTNTAAVARPAQEQGGVSGQFATFGLGHLTFGVEVRQVQEVIRYQQMTRVPLAQRTLRGLINLRGQIVTAIDMRRRCGIDDRDTEEPPMNVVVRTRDGVVSMLVDEIGDVVEPSAADFEPVPDTLAGVVRDIVNGVYKLQDRLLLVLDVERAAALEIEPAGEQRN